MASGLGTRTRPGRRARRSGLATERLEQRLAPAGLSLVGPTDVVFEGERAEFTLRLAQRSSRAETVFVTTSPGTATYGVDYMAPARQQILFAPGQTVQTFSISTLQETVPQKEGVETFFVTATAANTSLSAPLKTTVRIADYQPKPVISVADISVTEGHSDTTAATFTIRLNAPYARRVAVNYATRDGSATVADADYVAASGSLEFLAGETSKTVTVSVNGDRKLEANETFSLVLSAPVNADVGRATGVCTIVNDEADQPGFQITVDYTNPNLPAAQRNVFERAVARLQQIIVGDVPGVTLSDGRFIDDMRIRATVETMDPGLNGYARPLQFRPGSGGLPYDGEIFINAARIGNPGIYHTVIHEMLHALGFLGNFFSATNTVSGLGTTTPLFTGTNSVREYNSYFGLTSSPGVPLYGVIAQAGSYGSHWDTATIGTEIMSVGWDTTSTALRPFSRITVGALDDIGYDVSYAAADAYTRPADVALAQIAFAAVPAAAAKASASIEVVPVKAVVPSAPLRPSTNTTTGAAAIAVPAKPATTARPSTAVTPRTAPNPAQKLPSTPRISALPPVALAFATR